jgi:AraC-like DNA-binding protein
MRVITASPPGRSSRSSPRSNATTPSSADAGLPLSPGIRTTVGRRSSSGLLLLPFELEATAEQLGGRPDLSLAAIAGHTGYDSEVSLSKAFKREYGVPPGRYRLRDEEPIVTASFER